MYRDDDFEPPSYHDPEPARAFGMSYPPHMTDEQIAAVQEHNRQMEVEQFIAQSDPEDLCSPTLLFVGGPWDGKVQMAIPSVPRGCLTGLRTHAISAPGGRYLSEETRQSILGGKRLTMRFQSTRRN